MKNFAYKDIDGNHWPDAIIGDAQYYAIDFNEWLANQNDTLVSVKWIIPTGLTGTDDIVEANIAKIKLTPSARGVFRIVCEAITEEAGKQQTKAVPMMLKVY